MWHIDREFEYGGLTFAQWAFWLVWLGGVAAICIWGALSAANPVQRAVWAALATVCLLGIPLPVLRRRLVGPLFLTIREQELRLPKHRWTQEQKSIQYRDIYRVEVSRGRRASWIRIYHSGGIEHICNHVLPNQECFEVTANCLRMHMESRSRPLDEDDDSG